MPVVTLYDGFQKGFLTNHIFFGLNMFWIRLETILENISFAKDQIFCENCPNIRQKVDSQSVNNRLPQRYMYSNIQHYIQSKMYVFTWGDFFGVSERDPIVLRCHLSHFSNRFQIRVWYTKILYSGNSHTNTRRWQS